LTTNFEYSTEELITAEPTGEMDRRHFVQELVLEYKTAILTPQSLWISFMTGVGVNQRVYTVQDDGEGNFKHSKIVKGTINYQTRILDVIFTEPLADTDVKAFKCSYSYHVDYALPEGTELWASYYFTQQTISITEAGLRAKDGKLIVYATFPSIEFTSDRYHCNFLFMVKKP
jgi:hypothetical protein